MLSLKKTFWAAANKYFHFQLTLIIIWQRKAANPYILATV